MALLMSTIEELETRESHLPGISVFHGPSGFGKSFSAAFANAQYNCYYVQAQSSWTKKALVVAIAREMGIVPAKTIYEISDQISEQLMLSERVLLIDEMDHIVDKKAVEIIRDIYEASNGSILLIGEENLPNKLKRWERFHGRILNFVAALPADFEDAKQLRQTYCEKIEIADDLLKEIHNQARGSVRRICVNLDRVQQVCQTQGWKEVDLTGWEDTNYGFFTGEARRRNL